MRSARPVAARLQRLPDRAHAVRGVGETMNQKGAADDPAGRHHLIRAVTVPTDARGIGSAAAVVAVGRRRRRSRGRSFDPIAHVPKDSVLPAQVIGEGGGREIRCSRIRRHVAVPRFQIRQAPTRVDGAADDDGRTISTAAQMIRPASVSTGRALIQPLNADRIPWRPRASPDSRAVGPRGSLQSPDSSFKIVARTGNSPATGVDCGRMRLCARYQEVRMSRLASSPPAHLDPAFAAAGGRHHDRHGGERARAECDRRRRPRRLGRGAARRDRRSFEPRAD